MKMPWMTAQLGLVGAVTEWSTRLAPARMGQEEMARACQWCHPRSESHFKSGSDPQREEVPKGGGAGDKGKTSKADSRSKWFGCTVLCPWGCPGLAALEGVESMG